MKRRFAALCTLFCICFSIMAPVNAVVSDTGCSDVGAGAWYADAVAWCRENGLMAGVGGGRSAPDSSLPLG